MILPAYGALKGLKSAPGPLQGGLFGLHLEYIGGISVAIKLYKNINH